MIEVVGDIEKNQNTGEKTILIRATNTSIKMIKSAVEFYKGDADDTKNARNQEQLRQEIHAIWKVLNPS